MKRKILLLALISNFVCKAQFVSIEKNGICAVEIESLQSIGGWSLEKEFSGYSGAGYFIYKGGDNLNTTGVSTLEYKVYITNPGIYRFQWYSKVGHGVNTTESNDSWLKIPDAKDFYGFRTSDQHIVRPGGVCSTGSCPAGASLNGWFKIYSSGSNTDWTWSTRTSDSDAHNIFAKFDTAGIYTIQISGRSNYHAIDRFVLYKSDLITEETATSLSVKPSMIPGMNETLIYNLKNNVIIDTIFEINTLVRNIELQNVTSNLIDSSKVSYNLNEKMLIIKIYPKNNISGDGSLKIYSTLSDGKKLTSIQKFKILPFINKPPYLKQIDTLVYTYPSGIQRLVLDGLNDGNDGSQIKDIFLTAVFNPVGKISGNTIYNLTDGTAAMIFTPTGPEGFVKVTINMDDKGGIFFGGESKSSMSFYIKLIKDPTSSLIDKKNQHIIISPNPSNGVINLITNYGFYNYYEIYSFTGQLMQSGILSETQKNIEITNVLNGYYFLHLKGSNSIIEKFLIQR